MAEIVLLPAYIDDPDYLHKTIRQLLVQRPVCEHLDYFAAFQFDGIAGISADVGYRVADKSAGQLLAFVFENMKAGAALRPVVIFKGAFVDDPVDGGLPDFDFGFLWCRCVALREFRPLSLLLTFAHRKPLN